MTDQPTTTDPGAPTTAPFDTATARRHALALRNMINTPDETGEDPYLSWFYEAEDGTVYRKQDRVKPGQMNDRPVGIDVCVADACTMAHVPAFDGQQMPETAEAIAQIGAEMLTALARIERLTAQRRILIIQRDKAVDALEDRTAERDVLRSQLASRREWRQGIPTPEQLKHHEQHGGLWLVRDTVGHPDNRRAKLLPSSLLLRAPGAAQVALVPEAEEAWKTLVSRREYAPVDRDAMPVPWRDAAPPARELGGLLEWFVCSNCGPKVRADEDGCCATCGRDCAIANAKGITWRPELYDEAAEAQ